MNRSDFPYNPRNGDSQNNQNRNNNSVEQNRQSNNIQDISQIHNNLESERNLQNPNTSRNNINSNNILESSRHNNNNSNRNNNNNRNNTSQLNNSRQHDQLNSSRHQQNNNRRQRQMNQSMNQSIRSRQQSQRQNNQEVERLDPYNMNIEDLDWFLQENFEKNRMMSNIINKVNAYFNSILLAIVLILMHFAWDLPIIVAGFFLVFMEGITIFRQYISYTDEFLNKAQFIITCFDHGMSIIFKVIICLSNMMKLKIYMQAAYFICFYYLISIIASYIISRVYKLRIQGTWGSFLYKIGLGAQIFIFFLNYRDDPVDYKNDKNWKEILAPSYVMLTLLTLVTVALTISFIMKCVQYKFQKSDNQQQKTVHRIQTKGHFWIWIMMIGLTSSCYAFILTFQSQLRLQSSGLLKRYEQFQEDKITNDALDDKEQQLYDDQQSRVFFTLFFVTFYFILQIICYMFVAEDLMLFFRNIYFDNDELYTIDELFDMQEQFLRRQQTQSYNPMNLSRRTRKKKIKIKKRVIKEENVFGDDKGDKNVPKFISKLSSTFFKVIVDYKQMKKSKKQVQQVPHQTQQTTAILTTNNVQASHIDITNNENNHITSFRSTSNNDPNINNLMNSDQKYINNKFILNDQTFGGSPSSNMKRKKRYQKNYSMSQSQRTTFNLDTQDNTQNNMEISQPTNQNSMLQTRQNTDTNMIQSNNVLVPKIDLNQFMRQSNQKQGLNFEEQDEEYDEEEEQKQQERRVQSNQQLSQNQDQDMNHPSSFYTPQARNKPPLPQKIQQQSIHNNRVHTTDDQSSQKQFFMSSQPQNTIEQLNTEIEKKYTDFFTNLDDNSNSQVTQSGINQNQLNRKNSPYLVQLTGESDNNTKNIEDQINLSKDINLSDSKEINLNQSKNIDLNDKNIQINIQQQQQQQYQQQQQQQQIQTIQIQQKHIPNNSQSDIDINQEESQRYYMNKQNNNIEELEDLENTQQNPNGSQTNIQQKTQNFDNSMLKIPQYESYNITPMNMSLSTNNNPQYIPQNNISTLQNILQQQNQQQQIQQSSANNNNKANHTRHNSQLDIEEKYNEEVKEKIQEEDEENQQCLVCFCEEPNSIFQPCGHGGICYQCALDLFKKTSRCYLCREKIEEILKVEIQDNSDSDDEEQVYKIISKTKMYQEDVIRNLDSHNPSEVSHQDHQQQQQES